MPGYKLQDVFERDGPYNADAWLKTGRVSLCALAQTCRALQEPALDVLWYHKVGLHHLIQCMPEDAWEVFGGEVDPSHAVASRYKPEDTQIVTALQLVQKSRFVDGFHSASLGISHSTTGNALISTPVVYGGSDTVRAYGT